MNFFFKFLMVFFLLVIILNFPIILLNDEWISTNQLSQLSQHHQIFFNEGKYGYFQNGTPTSYFVKKFNILPYTDFIPIISYPFLKLTKFLGDIIPFYVSLIFSGILIYLALSLNQLKKDYSQILIVLSFFLLLINIVLYKPLVISIDSTHSEVFAIVLMNVFFFLCLVGILYKIFCNLFSDSIYPVFGTYVSATCSSYLFWMNTCKDHLATATCFALVILLLVLYIQKSDNWYLFSSFIVTGFLAWIRPELGAVIFLVLLFLIPVFYFRIQNRTQKNIINLSFFLSLFGTFIGIIPLIVNNALVTGHPLVLPFQVLNNYTIKSSMLTVIPGTAPMTPESHDILSSSLLDSIITIIKTVGDRIVPNIPLDTFLGNIYGVLISPSTLKVPILAIVPIFIIGIAFLPQITSMKWKKKKNEGIIIISLLFLSGGIFCAYFTSIAGLHTSFGIYPDIRYLSPVYIPLNIIGILFISKIFQTDEISQIFQYSILCSVIGPGIILHSLTVMAENIDFWSVFLWMNGLFTITIYFILLILFIFLINWYYQENHKEKLIILISISIALPLIWQISMILLIQCFIGTEYYYPPPLPIIREFFSWITG